MFWNRFAKGKGSKLLLSAFLGVILALWGNLFLHGELSPVTAQSLRPEYVAQLVYERLSYIPKENEYLRQDTGEVDEDNTLISRLVRYHQDIQRRPTPFRLDWKLTLADYLGANEPLKADRYPGNSTLQTNPMEKDIEAIGSLNRRQRQELVDVIVSLYNPQQAPSSNNTTPAPNSVPARPSTPPQSQPGDANLLMP